MKHLAEEICEENVSEGSVKQWCGALAVTQCGNCSKFLCSDCGFLCKTCRDNFKHDKYCRECINTHSHESTITTESENKYDGRKVLRNSELV